MSDTASFPLNFQNKGIIGHDGYIVAEAPCLAAKWIDEMPDKVRLVSDKRGILRILDTAFPVWEEVFGPA